MVRREWRDQRPRWWLLYATGLLMVGLLAVVEIFVPAGGLRAVLEIAGVMTGFGLMACWVRSNRVAMELEESRRPLGTTGHAGRPVPVRTPEHNGSHVAWHLRSRSQRAIGANASTQEVLRGR
jgi:hypothetical protein